MAKYDIFNCFYFGDTEKIKEYVLFDVYKKIYQLVLDYFQAEKEKFLMQVDEDIKNYFGVKFLFKSLHYDLESIFRNVDDDFRFYVLADITSLTYTDQSELLYITDQNVLTAKQKKKLSQIKSAYQKTKFRFMYFDGKNPEAIFESIASKIQIDLMDVCKKIKLGFSWLDDFNRAIKVKNNLSGMFTKKHGKINQQEEEKRKKICFNIYYKFRDRIILNEPIISLRETCRNEFNNDKGVRAVYKNPEALIKQMQRLLNALGEKDLIYKVKK